jgi:hypothetical protein
MSSADSRVHGAEADIDLSFGTRLQSFRDGIYILHRVDRIKSASYYFAWKYNPQMIRSAVLAARRPAVQVSLLTDQVVQVVANPGTSHVSAT